jgi:hypothetical protein
MDSVLKLHGFQWFKTMEPDQSGGAHSLKPDPHRSVWSQVGNQGLMQYKFFKICLGFFALYIKKMYITKRKLQLSYIQKKESQISVCWDCLNPLRNALF